MKLLKALFKHSWLVMRLRHDGAGMPANFAGVFLLISICATLVLVNKSVNNELTIEAVLALCLIAQFYLFSIRNAVIGLIILIGIIANLFSLGIAAVGPVSGLQIAMLPSMEFFDGFWCVD